MSPETVDAIQKALAPIAEKIGQGASFGWEVVVRQQYVEGLTGVIFGSAIILCITISIILAWVWSIKYATRNRDTDIYMIPLMMSVFGLIGVSLIGSWFYFSLLQLINPAYYALDFFIHLTK